MAKEKLTGRELQERLSEMHPQEILMFLKKQLEEVAPVLKKLPEDEEHSSPVAVWLLAAELGRRYANLLSDQFDAVNEVVGELMAASMAPLKINPSGSKKD